MSIAATRIKTAVPPGYDVKKLHRGQRKAALDRGAHDRIVRAKVDGVGLMPDHRTLRSTAWNPLPDAEPVALLDLEPGQCKWPIGDGKPFLFCGVATTHGPYCDRHAEMSRGRGTEAERAANRAREKVTL